MLLGIQTIVFVEALAQLYLRIGYSCLVVSDNVGVLYVHLNI